MANKKKCCIIANCLEKIYKHLFIFKFDNMDNTTLFGIAIGVIVIILGFVLVFIQLSGYEKAGIPIALLGVVIAILSFKLGNKK